MFSYFANHSQNIPIGFLTIEELHRQLVNPDREPFLRNINLVRRLRATADEAEQRKIKAELLAFCPGGMLDTRQANATLEQKNIRYSGFSQVDIDLKDNPNITDAALFRDKLAEIPYIAMAGISAKGKGIWGLMALDEPEKFMQYAESIYNYFEQARVTIDKSKSRNPTELRYFAPDPGAILKTDYLLFPLVLNDRPQPKQLRTFNNNYTGTTLEAAHKWVAETTCYSLVDGQKHNYLFWLSYALRKNGTDEAEVYQVIYNKVLSSAQIRSNCISGGIAYANAKGIFIPQQQKYTLQFSGAQPPNTIESKVETPSVINGPAKEASSKPPWQLLLEADFYLVSANDNSLPDPEIIRPPLKPATGKLKDLEDTFIRLTQQRRKHRVDYTSIISLFDKYKRIYPTEEQLTELESMLKP